MSELLTPEQVARLLGTTPRSVREIPSSELHRYRIGHRTVRFDIEDVKAYLASNKEAA